MRSSETSGDSGVRTTNLPERGRARRRCRARGRLTEDADSLLLDAALNLAVIRRAFVLHLLLMRRGWAWEIDGYEDTGFNTDAEAAEGKMI